MYNQRKREQHPVVRDFGPEAMVFPIAHATQKNENYRLAIWTGKDLQLTLMSIPVGGEIGRERHEDGDQFIRIENGRAAILMGRSPNSLREEARVDGSYAILIPAGIWHNVVNVGNTPLKLYSLYAPAHHPRGTVQKTREDAEREAR